MDDIQFDLPELDDSNSILLLDGPPPAYEAVKPVVPSSSSSSEAPPATTTVTIEMMRPDQAARLPVAWNFERANRNAHFFSDRAVPIYTVQDYKVVVENKKLRPSRAFMPTCGLLVLDDNPIPCYWHSELKVSNETMKNWQNALATDVPLAIHDCAARFAHLFDATQDGSPKLNFGTTKPEQSEHCVLTSTHDSMSSICFESAVTENPLLNALIVAALSGSWLEISPTLLRSVIDAVVYRYRRTQPCEPQGSDLVANFCVEDTTASTASFSVVVPQVDELIADGQQPEAAYKPWTSPHFYYDSLATSVSDAIKAQFTGKRADDKSVDDKSITDAVKAQLAEEKKLAALEVALCSQRPTRIFSMRDGAKGIAALQKTFIHPNTTNQSDDLKKRLSEKMASMAMLNNPSEQHIAASTTLEGTYNTISALETERSKPPSELDALKEDASPPEPPEGACFLSKLIVTGHFTEWRMFVERLKEQIRLSPRDLQMWLGAMLWLIMQFCKMRDNYKHPEGIYNPPFVTEKDLKFLRITVGENMASLFADEPPTSLPGNVANVLGFFKRFFWFKPETNRVGGLALLLFPFETGLFLTIPKPERKTLPFINGSLLRVLHTLVPIGVSAADIFDVRTRCQYRINSSYWEIERTITHGVAGFSVSSSHFKTLQSANSLLIRIVVAAFDNVTAIHSRELVHRLPEPNGKADNQYTIDRSLERFAVFPQLLLKEDGKMQIIYEKRETKGRAGFDLPQVSRALTAANSDDAMMKKVFDSHLAAFKETKQETVAQVLDRPKKQLLEKAQKEKLLLQKEKDEAERIAKVREQQAKAEADRAAQQKAQQAKAKADALAKREKDRLQRLEREKQKAEMLEKKQRDAATALAQKKYLASKQKSGDQLQSDAKLARDLQRRELETSSNSDAFDDFIQVSRRGKKKAVASGNNSLRESVVSTETVFGSSDDSGASTPSDTPSNGESSEFHADALSNALLATETVAEPVAAVSLFVAEPDAPSSLPASLPVEVPVTAPEAASLPIELPLVDEKPADAPLLVEKAPFSVEEPVAEPLPASTTLSVEEFVAAPLLASTSLPVEEPVAASLPASTPIGEPLPTVAETSVALLPTPGDTIFPVLPKSFYYRLPSDQIIDHDALRRSLHGMRASISHIRLWLQLASRDRAFTHENHVLIDNRERFSREFISTHIMSCSDGTCRMLTPWSILTSAFDGVVLSTPKGAALSTMIIGGSVAEFDDSQFMVLSQIGKFIFQSVVSSAAYSPYDVRKNTDCSTCYLCQRAAPFRFCFVPQHIDAKHTLATRLIPLCTSDACSELLLEKVGNRSHEGGCAKIPGLRVFFNFDNTVTVCESESDAYKFSIGASSSLPPSPVVFSNADYSLTNNLIYVQDRSGNIFALPQPVAQKSYYLAQFALADIT